MKLLQKEDCSDSGTVAVEWLLPLFVLEHLRRWVGDWITFLQDFDGEHVRELKYF